MQEKREEQAFRLLMDAVVQHGVDKRVENPAGILEKAMGISRRTALAYLRVWELGGRIRRYSNTQTGFIDYVCILSETPPERLYEQSEEQRLIRALWEHRRPSKERPGSFMVHATFFPDVKAAADIDDKRFYLNLTRLTARGFIQPVSYTVKNSRYLYLVLTPKFPQE